MKYNPNKGSEIDGDLDIFSYQNDDNETKIMIHGDPEGLRSFAKLLLEIADLKQEEVSEEYLPIGAREHYHLRPKIELSKSSNEVIVGRLDAKGTGDYYDRFESKNKD
ncbi:MULTISPECIES: Imm32 family immunity protein [Epilithonimonas]|uniref:Imm32 family immunity protein n=1 Tax=Epilithonimonas TaxID=2782229 RepID=UPI00289644E7|nr:MULTISPECIES: hypothetical protein [Epilithonimonas]